MERKIIGKDGSKMLLLGLGHPLSSYGEGAFVLPGNYTEFHSAYQAYAWLKCRHFGDFERARRIASPNAGPCCARLLAHLVIKRSFYL